MPKPGIFRAAPTGGINRRKLRERLEVEMSAKYETRYIQECPDEAMKILAVALNEGWEVISSNTIASDSRRDPVDEGRRYVQDCMTYVCLKKRRSVCLKKRKYNLKKQWRQWLNIRGLPRWLK